jgi:hypothetical protein
LTSGWVFWLVGLVHSTTAAVAAPAARTGRHVGLALAYGDDRHHPLKILRLAGGAGRFGVPEDQLLELARTLVTYILVKWHGLAPLESIG